MELLPQCLHTFNLSHPELMEAGVEIFSLYWQPCLPLLGRPIIVVISAHQVEPDIAHWLDMAIRHFRR
jgi:hypothetical protein